MKQVGAVGPSALARGFPPPRVSPGELPEDGQGVTAMTAAWPKREG